MMPNTSTDTIEREIKDAYKAMGTSLANQSAFGATTWEANSQYGYTLSVHATQTEAERAAIDCYRTRMNLIRQ